eukprot:COSAG02_NODE_7563_length_2960_cov_0.992310_3_plen_227_part_01
MDRYPEWEVSLGKPTKKAVTVEDLKRTGCAGIYQRIFEHGLALVNPTKGAITVTLDKTMHKVTPAGGGPIQLDGSVYPPGILNYDMVSSVVVPASSAAILLDTTPDDRRFSMARLKTDDREPTDMHCMPYCQVPLYTLWTHSVPTPPGFTSPGPHVYNTTLLDVVANIVVTSDATATTAEADTFITVRGYWDTHENGSSWIVFRYSPTQVGTYVVTLTINGQQPTTA